MKKYYLQILLGSALIGIIVRLVNQHMMGLPVDTNVSNYIESILIGAMCGLTCMTTYLKFLIHNRWRKWVKYLLSYLIISIVYFGLNILVSGIDYLNDPFNYFLGIMILILATPIIYFGEKNYSIYYEGLTRKKAMNRLKK